MVADLGSPGQRAKIALAVFGGLPRSVAAFTRWYRTVVKFGNRLAHNGPVFSTHTGPLGTDTT